MKKFTKKWQIILYGCSGLGINMLNMVMGTYLCSALLVGGFDKDVELWTYLNKDLVIPGVWMFFAFGAKVIDGVIDIPLSTFTDNLKTRWGKRRPSMLIGFIPMMLAFLLFMVPLTDGASLLNTIWLGVLLCIFYTGYTLTMLTYYATFSEITEKESDVVLLSNVKSICDVVYFSLSFALFPVFISLGFNVRVAALIFVPLAACILIPLLMLKEEPTNHLADNGTAPQRATLWQSLGCAFKNKSFVYWMLVCSVMNLGLQLFLGGINEFFSSTGLNMTFIMASAFAPVPFTLQVYNKIVKKKGLGTGYRFVLLMFSVGMLMMCFCGMMPEAFKLWYAILCGVIVSFAIGAFFSVTYTVPSHLAAIEQEKTGKPVASMYFAVQGLFQGITTGLATGVILVNLKTTGTIHLMTVIVAVSCMAAFALSFFFSKEVSNMGKIAKKV